MIECLTTREDKWLRKEPKSSVKGQADERLWASDLFLKCRLYNYLGMVRSKDKKKIAIKK